MPVTASDAISTTPDEHVVGPCRRVGKREAGGSGAQQQHRDQRSQGVEAPVLELGGAEERGGERRQQVRTCRPSVDPEEIVEASTIPAAPASVPGDHERHEPQAVHADAGEL